MISLDNRFEVLLPASLFPMFYMLAYPKFLIIYGLFEFLLFFILVCPLTNFFCIVSIVRTIVIIIIIIKYLKRLFYYYVRKQACHTAFFLKCLHNARPLDGSDSLKCLPNRPHSLKCLLNMHVTIHFPLIFGYSLVCSEFGQYCSSPTLLVHWLMLARWFVGCCLLLFDSTLQS
jgi:hypothetical protein